MRLAAQQSHRTTAAPIADGEKPPEHRSTVRATRRQKFTRIDQSLSHLEPVSITNVYLSASFACHGPTRRIHGAPLLAIPLRVQVTALVDLIGQQAIVLNFFRTFKTLTFSCLDNNTRACCLSRGEIAVS